MILAVLVSSLLQGSVPCTIDSIENDKYGNLHSCVLSRDYVISGYKLRGGTTILLYGQRVLHSGILAREQIVAGIVVSRRSRIYLYRDSRPQMIVVGDPMIYKSYALISGDIILWDDHGNVQVLRG